jgi:hypothetical protein
MRGFMEEVHSKAPNISSTSTAVSPVQRPDFRRTEDFVTRYANNVQLESSAFDLKIIFGLFDQSGILKQPPVTTTTVDQHTSVSLSWSEVKLLIYFLQLHLASFEKDNGKVKIPVKVLPPEIPLTPPPPFDNEEGQRAFELMRRMRAEFIANQSEP